MEYSKINVMNDSDDTGDSDNDDQVDKENTIQIRGINYSPSQDPTSFEWK